MVSLLRRTDPSPERIRAYIEQQQCWICGKAGWVALSQHLVKKHGLPASEVREMAYMFKTERLISPELAECMSKASLRKFGKRRHIPIRGEKRSPKKLSTKLQDTLRKRIKVIRPLAVAAHHKLRHSHPCPVCGTMVPTARPLHCSPQCVHINSSESAKKAMTPERVAFFRTVMYKPTPEEQSRWSKEYWRKRRELPLEEQRKIGLAYAASRRVRVYKNCVICGKQFDIIPSHADEQVTCGNKVCTKKRQSIMGTGRRHTLESIAKMSEHAKQRHQIEGGQFGRPNKKEVQVGT